MLTNELWQLLQTADNHTVNYFVLIPASLRPSHLHYIVYTSAPSPPRQAQMYFLDKL